MSGIDWLAFPTVFVASLVGAVTVVALFATAIRLFATPPHGSVRPGGRRDEELDPVGDPTRPRAATVGGVVLFGLSGLAVLFGIYLIVPYFSG